MQVELNDGMPRPPTSLAIRLKLARKSRALTQNDLAEAAEMKQSDISKIESGKTQQTPGIGRLARALGVPVEWLELGEGAEPEWEKPAPLKVGGMAHVTSLPKFDSQLLNRERIMTMERVPPSFVYELGDDAMAPLGRAGTQVLFVRVDDPSAVKIGAGVLIVTKHDEIHVRRMAQGTEPGHWIAKAQKADVYRSFDSKEDGLRILAVWRGVVNVGLEDS